MFANRNLKARYRTVGPKRELVTYRKCWMDENKSMQSEDVTEEMECYYVFFPNGHSIRFTSLEKLKEHGLHLKPRIVDMETGDVVDVGGDPYNFGDDPLRDVDVALIEDDATRGSGGRRKKADTL